MIMGAIGGFMCANEKKKGHVQLEKKARRPVWKKGHGLFGREFIFFWEGTRGQS